MLPFINNRPFFFFFYIQQEFELNKQVSVTLNVYPPNAGTIKISTIIPDKYPWSGIYFDGAPVEITAFPNPGYEFSFWQSVHLLPYPFHQESFILNIDTNDVFTAYFYGSPDTARITINEINYNSSDSMDAGDWFELHNYGNIDIDLSGWLFKDSNDNNEFIFPAHTILNRGQYLVICRDTAKFAQIFPDVTNFIGQPGFGLSSAGDMLRIFDADDCEVINMEFSGTEPWPLSANGQGKTLELLDPYGDLNSPSNWFAGCMGGSPGTAFIPCDMYISELTLTKTGFNIYPNPANEIANVTFSLDYTQYAMIRLIDQYGRIVYFIEGKNIPAGYHNISIPVHELNSGIYYCLLITSDLTYSKKLVVNSR
ncbi:MAG: lamin tail domain-containing protein [Bacteroidia bacterium]|nr:lamin tail domain-containing protein [Bacteroidia bacterium]